MVQAVVLKRNGEAMEAVLRGVRSMIDAFNETPGRLLPGVRIVISATRVDAASPDDFAEAFEAPNDGGLVKVFGQDLEGLATVGETVRKQLETVPGVEALGVIPETGKAGLSLAVDREKCARWDVATADVVAVISAARDGLNCTQMVEGSELYHVVVCSPARCRRKEEAIMSLPVDTGGGVGPVTPRLRLRDVVESRDNKALLAAVAIYRENGERLMAVRFRGDAKAAAAAQRAVAVPTPYRTVWVGR